jgi:uncharacterized protein (TIGR02186 family)
MARGLLSGALLLVALFLSALPVAAPARAQGKALAVDLAERQVEITTGFNGSRLVLFGTKKAPGEIAVVVRGPRQKVTVRRKARALGMWMNRTSLKFWRVPSFYDVAVSRGLEGEAALLHRAGIGLGGLDFKPDRDEEAARVARFKEAMIRLRQAQGLFPLAPRPVTFMSGDFFRADFAIPANVPTGDYQVTAYLFRDGREAARQEETLHIGQAGFPARLSKFARRKAFLYGLACILFAALAGAAGHALMQRD